MEGTSLDYEKSVNNENIKSEKQTKSELTTDLMVSLP